MSTEYTGGALGAHRKQKVTAKDYLLLLAVYFGSLLFLAGAVQLFDNGGGPDNSVPPPVTEGQKRE